MFVNNFVSDVIASETESNAKSSNPINEKAEADFKYLCGRSNFTLSYSLGFLKLSKDDEIGDFYVIGAESSENMVSFLKDRVKLEDPKSYVGLVLYNNGNVVDVYVFHASDFKATGMFSMFKDLSKTGEFGIKIPALAKKPEYRFVEVLRQYIG